MRAVLFDVNVIVAAILAPHGTTRQLLQAWEAQRFPVLTSEGIISQIEEKLRDPKIGGAYGVTEEDVVWVRRLLMTQAKVVVVRPHDVTSVTDDPEDDYVLATSRIGRVGYIVTGDMKLQALKEYGGAQLLNPRAFLELLNSHPPK